MTDGDAPGMQGPGLTVSHGRARDHGVSQFCSGNRSFRALLWDGVWRWIGAWGHSHARGHRFESYSAHHL